MQADAEGGKVRGLNLAFEEGFSLGLGQLNQMSALIPWSDASRMPALTHSNRSLTVACR